eukprot:g37310.t1
MEMLNEYFTSAFAVEKDMEARELEEINNDILKCFHITEEVVLDALKRTKLDKSLEPDQMHPRTLWGAREVIAGPFAEIFLSLIATDVVPEDWRLAKVVPLFRKDGKEKLGNYRPVSLISVVDDTKIGNVVDSEEGYLRVQRDLDQMGKWAEEWQLELNLNKCEVLHF